MPRSREEYVLRNTYILRYFFISKHPITKRTHQCLILPILNLRYTCISIS